MARSSSSPFSKEWVPTLPEWHTFGLPIWAEPTLPQFLRGPGRPELRIDGQGPLCLCPPAPQPPQGGDRQGGQGSLGTGSIQA